MDAVHIENQRLEPSDAVLKEVIDLARKECIIVESPAFMAFIDSLVQEYLFIQNDMVMRGAYLPKENPEIVYKLDFENMRHRTSELMSIMYWFIDKYTTVYAEYRRLFCACN